MKASIDFNGIDDVSLLKAVAGGNPQALSALYDRYGRLVYSLAYRSLGDGLAAEEVTQDVFLQVWNKALTYQEQHGKVVTWLASIARYRAIDVFRRKKARPEEVEEAWGDGEDLFDLVDNIVVEDVVEVKQLAQRVRQAIKGLPEEQRYVLGLAYFNGMSHQEIADTSGESLGTVKTRLRLAMQKLQKSLGHE